MEVRKNFGKYWLAGLIFLFIAGAIQWVTSYWGGLVNLYFQPGWLWGLIVGLAGILMLIFIPWIYGRLMEWVYLNFIKKE